jgi:uncharacterized protein YndB with AHSA1/START domain
MPGRLVLLVLLAAHGAGVEAEVVDATAGGFLVRNEAVVAAAPEEVYRRLTSDAGHWWNPSHTWSGSAANLDLDAQAGGCFCERWAGGSVQHAEVVFALPGKTLRLRGALGPLQELGVTGSLSWSLEAAGEGTRVVQSYDVGGHREGGLADFAAPVSAMLADQLARLKRYVETGRPD